MTFYRLESLSQLENGYRQVFRLNGIPLVLMQEEGQRYLLKNVCPHKGFPLHTGTYADGHLRCAYHAFDFNLKCGGQCTQHPSQSVTLFPLLYEGDEVGVDSDKVSA